MFADQRFFLSARLHTAAIVGQHPQWDAALAALLAKYPQYQTTPLFLGAPTLICFEALTVRSWAAAGAEGIADSLANDNARHA